MRGSIIWLMALLTIGKAAAEEWPLPPAAPPSTAISLAEAAVPEINPPGRGKAITGAVLIAFGAVSALTQFVGIGLMAHPCPGDIDKNNCYLIPGAYTAGFSALAASIQFGIGVPLLVAGRREMKRAVGPRLTGASIAPLMAPSRSLTGGTLGLRFEM